jgi:hypothetical protein
MESDTNKYEDELIDDLAEAFSIATEFMDAQTIIKCIKVALERDKDHHQSMLTKYQTIENSISSI